ncbi:MAG: nucleotidyltransferase family protein [Bacteroidales bacterium]|jgi:hypothetical protein|nr:nucleotidyltransferase family protein [Bacteroidales bacterium]
MKNDLNIRDEEILLLGLCRLSFDAELTVMLRALTEETKDWNFFTELANVHGVSALVYSNLEKLKFLQFVPEEIVDQLRNSMMINLSRNTRNIEAMAEVLKLLNGEGIKTVLLKGLALELSVYGNAGLRQMTDVDVLVSRENCMKARRILMDNGFSSLPVKSVFHKAILADVGKHLPSLIKEGFQVELHHELFGAGKNVLTKMLFESSYETEIKEQKVFIPRAQIFFLYLVKHLYLHEMNNESQLRLYGDLVVLIEKFRDDIINYDLLIFAKQAGMEEILAWRIEPLRDLWGISFPGWINDFINKHYNPASINKFVFFLKSPKNNPVRNKALVYRHHLGEIPGLHRKILFLLGDLFPTIRFMKKRYNCRSGWKSLLYYPLRWGKLWYLVR